MQRIPFCEEFISHWLKSADFYQKQMILYQKEDLKERKKDRKNPGRQQAYCLFDPAAVYYLYHRLHPCAYLLLHRRG
jgi:hypothetical protein